MVGWSDETFMAAHNFNDRMLILETWGTPPNI